MKTNRITLVGVGFIAFALSHATAQFPGRWGSGQFRSNQVQKASAETEAYGLTKFAGKPLRAANQEQLGTVSDFLLETQSGHLRFALVPSGGGASGDTYRLVPMNALDPSSNNDALVVRINRDQWDRVGTMTERELPGRFSLPAEVPQRYAQQFGVSPENATSNDFTRASKWKGQTVHSSTEQLGSIDDVIVDIPSRTAMALFKPTGGYAAADQKFVIPFARLTLSGDSRAPIVTDLTRNDFQAAASAFLPTGTSSNQFGQNYGAFSSAASTVQQALTREPSLLAGAGVQVMPETRLVLRGTAQNEAQRQAIEATARQSAPNMQIDNQITVQGR